MKRKLRPWVKVVLTLFPLAGSAALTKYPTDLPQLQNPNSSMAEEYIHTLDEEPLTLEAWQKINPRVKYVLRFTDKDKYRAIPVVCTPDAAYALKHNVRGENDTMGSVFCDPCASNPVNLVIYGHSSKTKDWCFTFLKQYRDKDYFQNHPSFLLESQEGLIPCRIISSATYDLEEETETGWADPNTGNTEEVMQMIKDSIPYLDQRREGEVYEGGGLVTLVTCDMEKTDSRIVIQALREIG